MYGFDLGRPINRLEVTRLTPDEPEPDLRSSVRTVGMTGMSTADRGRSNRPDRKISREIDCKYYGLHGLGRPINRIVAPVVAPPEPEPDLRSSVRAVSMSGLSTVNRGRSKRPRIQRCHLPKMTPINCLLV